MNATRRFGATHLLLAGALALGAGPLATRLAAQYYRVEAVPNFLCGGPKCLNAAGTLVGQTYGTFTQDPNYYGGISFQAGVFTELGTLPGAGYSDGAAINASGYIAGMAADSSGGFYVCTFNSSGPTNLASLAEASAGFAVSSVNASGSSVGEILGIAPNDAIHGFLCSGTTITDLGTLPGSITSAAIDINDSGTIVGQSADMQATYAIEIPPQGTMQDLGWGPNSIATSINNANVIVGQITTSSGALGVMSVGGVQTDLGGLSSHANTYPTSINNAGTVVGTSLAPDASSHAFVYTGGRITDLNALISLSGDTLDAATTVSDSGQIVARGGNGDSVYLLTPVTVHFVVSAPAAVHAGAPFQITVTAVDAGGALVDYYPGSIRFASSDPAAVLPAAAGLSSGTGTFTVTLSTVGPQTITATDTVFAGDMGTSGSVGVGAGPIVTGQPSDQSVAAGATATFTVTASGTPAPTFQWSFNGTPIAGATSASYSLASVQASDSGYYTVTASNAEGTSTSQAAILTVTSPEGPTIAIQPTSVTVVPGASVALAVGANTPAGTGADAGPSARATSACTYQWFYHGMPLADGAGILGATMGTLDLSGLAARAGSYECLVANAAGSVLTQAASLTLSASTQPGRLVNVSCRADAGSGPSELVAGFVLGGGSAGATDAVLVRASGPALVPFGVSGTLADPSLELYDTAASTAVLVAANAGWGGGIALTNAFAALGAFAWTDPASADSALVESLPAGPYTANISGKSGDAGVALVEVYDANPAAGPTGSPRLINLSARTQVGSGGGVLIAGFVIGGTTDETVLIRASGPALAPFGVASVLADPQLTLRQGATVRATNTGWAGSAVIASAASSVGAFSWGPVATADSAVLITLAPGAYTAEVAGAAGDTGAALVEVYDVP